MSHRNRGRNLSEWADLVGASLPDSVEDGDGERSGSDGRLGTDAERGVGTDAERDVGTDVDRGG